MEYFELYSFFRGFCDTNFFLPDSHLNHKSKNQGIYFVASFLSNLNLYLKYDNKTLKVSCLTVLPIFPFLIAP